MSIPLQPRKVERPFLTRWLRTTFQLMFRSPLRFGMVIAVLGMVDTSVVTGAKGSVLEKEWIQYFGQVALPLLWVLVTAVSRGADDSRLTWTAFAHLLRKQVWLGAFGVGISVALLTWTINKMGALLVKADAGVELQRSGQVIESLAASVAILYVFVGLCYFPLLVLVPDASLGGAKNLSRQAADLNDWTTMFVVVTSVGLIADTLSAVIPAYGMTSAAILVFMGVLNYVAYRDIFEGRSDHHPKHVEHQSLAMKLQRASSAPSAH
jgi:hypothetical protein